MADPGAVAEGDIRIGETEDITTGSPQVEQSVSSSRQGETTARKERVRRDCEPDTDMFRKIPDKFRSSNKQENWENISQAKEDIDTSQRPTGASTSLSEDMPTDPFPAMPLQTISRNAAHASSSSSGSAVSPVVQAGRTGSHTTSPQSRLEPQPRPKPKPKPKPQPQNQSRQQLQNRPNQQLQPPLPPKQSQTQLLPQSQATEPQQQSRNETVQQSQTQSNRPGSGNDSSTDGVKSHVMRSCGSEKELKSPSNSSSSSTPSASADDAEKCLTKNTKPGVIKDEDRHGKDPVMACTCSAKALLDHTGDTAEVVHKKEEIIYEMSLAQTRSSTMKTVRGLALHLLTLQNWQVDKLLSEYTPGNNIHETGVRNILNELVCVGKTLGDIVQYFTMDHSKRLDIVRLVEQIHKGCPFCDNIYASIS